MSVKISDIIIPSVFNPYVLERTAELSALVQSGIIVPDSVLDRLASSGGKTINMPFYNDLTGDDEVLADDAPLTPGGIGMKQDVAVLFMRGRAWGVNDLAEALSGDDPMGTIANLVAEYWNRRMQALLVSELKGVFADNSGNDSGDHIYDISKSTGVPEDVNLISADAVISAVGLMGDSLDKIVAICLHSANYVLLQKANLIDFTADNAQNVGFGTYLGKSLIVDDSCPITAADGEVRAKYITYLFGKGAVGYGNGNPPVPTEVDRDSLAGEDYLINRKHFVLHPRGIAFQSVSIGADSPSNAECEEAQQWNRVYESKNFRVVELISNIAKV